MCTMYSTHRALGALELELSVMSRQVGSENQTQAPTPRAESTQPMSHVCSHKR